MFNNYNMRIKEIRKMKGLTQKDIAFKLGVKNSTFSKYERGELYPNSNLLKQIADILGVNVNMLYDDYDYAQSKNENDLIVEIYNNIQSFSKAKLEKTLNFITNLKNSK